jgi:type II secretory pathway predicted ATPase ExeA
MNKVLSTYGLAREPFTKDIAPTEMLQTEPLQEALQSLKAAVEGRASAVIT